MNKQRQRRNGQQDRPLPLVPRAGSREGFRARGFKRPRVKLSVCRAAASLPPRPALPLAFLLPPASPPSPERLAGDSPVLIYAFFLFFLFVIIFLCDFLVGNYP